MREETASVGVLEDEDVVGVGCWLLIGFITLKGNFLAISETLDHISMMDGLEDIKLILEVELLLPEFGGNHLQHHLLLPFPVPPQL